MSENNESPKETTPEWRPPDLDPSNMTAEQREEIYRFVNGKVYARSVKGHFHKWRVVMIWFTQLIFFGLPWIPWDGRQAVLFDLATRKFYIFGLILFPRDIIYMAVILILSAYGLFLFTALMGRLFCGYACPQTVYTEIFMFVELKVEGDRNARMRLDKGPWNFNRIWRKALKHFIWICIALCAGLTLVGYFVPIKTAVYELFHLEFGGWEWFWFLFYALIMWLHAGILRDNVCKYMCPYARFQSVMIDSDTMIVTYDRQRGENRGKRSKKADPRALGLGDCIDCEVCVQVCPTGIDIRNGLQYMCIGCGACIDGCNDIMDKMGYARGLIRYTSENAVRLRKSHKEALRSLFKVRTLIYLSLMFVAVCGLLYSLFTRSLIGIEITKDRGVLSRLVHGETIENVYVIQLTNMTDHPQTYTVSAQSSEVHDVKLLLEEEDSETSVISVDSLGTVNVPMVIQAPMDSNTNPGNYDVTVKVKNQDPKDMIETTATAPFNVPRL